MPIDVNNKITVIALEPRDRHCPVTKANHGFEKSMSPVKRLGEEKVTRKPASKIRITEQAFIQEIDGS